MAGVLLLGAGLLFFVKTMVLIVWNVLNPGANKHPDAASTIQEPLMRIEVIDKKCIRYHFPSQQIDLHIPCGKTYHTVHYDRRLYEAESLINTPVKLTYTTYPSGVHVLLDLVYDQYLPNTSVAPLTEKDRKNLLTWVNLGFGLFWGFLLLVTFTGIAASRFDSQTIFVMLAIVVPITLLSYAIWYFQRRPVTQAKNKNIITTTISEKITVLEPHIKSNKHDTYYRLADGHIFYTNDKRFKPGDTVIVTFMQHKNGNNDRLISISRK
ncbi:hypothetical protein [Chitinophaga pinensis]|uniref:Uncharacterized protein n=1 Tax=Chitinophaga pinensis (strain ATCC 43595 / DSM 2588 / LMG 13176 / NBRC 15968 / NCIMB 11800 / UQM 2034) TaxID=485918 RepID=A0A979GXF3_CHIPD|nr:hypothetical protein [Chitinophaga pinensis]ACU62509.1 hypothetical protein Cpin_5077 [Chitinophaga pinensis DSM 2588]